MRKFDLAVVGSGAGLVVLEAALDAGVSCAIVERAKFGGTCLNKGCIPTKILAYPADLIREVQHAEKTGVHVSSPGVDWQTLSERMWKQIGLNRAIEKQLLGAENLAVFKGAGEFTGPGTMRVVSSDGKTGNSKQSVSSSRRARAPSFRRSGASGNRIRRLGNVLWQPVPENALEKPCSDRAAARSAWNLRISSPPSARRSRSSSSRTGS
jgi:hypothetical protein